MSYINQTKIYYPIGIRLEIQIFNEYSILWVSGEYGTWFLKLNNRQYQINLVSQNHLNLKTISFYNIIKHYYTSSYKYATPRINAYISLACILIKRMIIGAGVGFKKYLRVRGVGYKFELQNSFLTAKVGYTHLVKKRFPYDFYIRFSRKAKVVRLRSKSLTRITKFIAHVRSMRRPDVYKGKGIRYKRDPIRRKPGKRKTRAVSKKKIFNAKKMIKRRRRRKKEGKIKKK